MARTKLPLLLCVSVSSMFAEIVTVNLSGVTIGGNYTVVQNSYSGLFSGLPANYLTTGATTTILGAGTAWTAQFTYDTLLLPGSVQTNVSGLNGADPITTHQSNSAALQWTTATFTIGGFTFTTAASAADIAPTPAPPDQSGSITTPVSYGSRIAYGDTAFGAQGFHGFSSVQSGYTFLDLSTALPNPSASDYGRTGALSFHIYQANDQGPLYTGGGIPSNYSWADTDLPSSGSHYGFGFAGFSSYQDHFTTSASGDLNVSASFYTASGADLVVTSAVTAGYRPTDFDPTPVPEPSNLILGGIGAALIGWARYSRG